MLKKDPRFTRLKFGGRSNAGASSTYWLAADHLLVVEVTNYNERYRRFYLRDIQALVVQRNRQRLWGNVVAGIIAGLTGIVALAMLGDGETGGGVFFGIVALIAIVGGLINTLRGPTCSVHLRTAVQSQKLNGIVRWAKAEQFFDALTPVINAAQTAGGPSPAEAAAAQSP